MKYQISDLITSDIIDNYTIYIHTYIYIICSVNVNYF